MYYSGHDSSPPENNYRSMIMYLLNVTVVESIAISEQTVITVLALYK